MKNGWVKLHRKILDSLVFGNEKALKIWIWCLLKANHSGNTFLLGRTKITLSAGQFVMGSDRAIDELNIAKATIWYWLNFLEREGQVRLQKNAKYTVVTIPKWKEYQFELDADETQSRPEIERQVGTNKNVKKVKNEKKDTAQSADVPKVIDLFKEVNPSYQRLFGMPPQRAAAERLLKTHGLERLTSMIAFLPKSNTTKYAPTITTPAQFEQKLGELIAWSQKQKDIKSANVAFV